MQSMTTSRQIGWAYVSPLRRERIEVGIAALARIDDNQAFYAWRDVGQALIDLRAAAQDQAGANTPTGRAYNLAWARVVADNPALLKLSKIDSATRTNAMWLAEHWDTVAEWHAAELDDSLRRLINHPATVRRRFNLDHPLPPKPRPEKPELGEPDDDPIDIDDDTEIYEPDPDYQPDPTGTPTGEEEPDMPETVEDWLNQFEAFWRRIPVPVRVEIAQRIALWLSDSVERAGQQEPAELDLIDEAQAEINQAVTKDQGAKVRAHAARKAAISATTEPTPERLAQVVEEALAKPSTEDEDIFAGLDSKLEVEPPALSPERLRARQPRRQPKAKRK